MGKKKKKILHPHKLGQWRKITHQYMIFWQFPCQNKLISCNHLLKKLLQHALLTEVIQTIVFCWAGMATHWSQFSQFSREFRSLGWPTLAIELCKQQQIIYSRENMIRNLKCHLLAGNECMIFMCNNLFTWLKKGNKIKNWCSKQKEICKKNIKDFF